jgi:hypothetical protein
MIDRRLVHRHADGDLVGLEKRRFLDDLYRFADANAQREVDAHRGGAAQRDRLGAGFDEACEFGDDGVGARGQVGEAVEPVRIRRGGLHLVACRLGQRHGRAGEDGAGRVGECPFDLAAKGELGAGITVPQAAEAEGQRQRTEQARAPHGTEKAGHAREHGRSPQAIVFHC